MIIFVNENNEIKDVGSTTDVTLTGLVIADNDENPFKDWSVAKICCYRATVENGLVNMLTPYVDTRLIEHIDQLGKTTEVNAEDITNTQLGLADTYIATTENADAITVCEEALAEVYELIIGGGF